jgi:hypothetical protein
LDRASFSSESRTLFEWSTNAPLARPWNTPVRKKKQKKGRKPPAHRGHLADPPENSLALQALFQFRLWHDPSCFLSGRRESCDERQGELAHDRAIEKAEL